MIRRFAKAIAVSIVFTSGLLLSCAEIKQAGKTIGHTTRDVTREIGHGTRDVAKEIGHGTKKVVKTIGHGTKETAKSISGDSE